MTSTHTADLVYGVTAAGKSSYAKRLAAQTHAKLFAIGPKEALHA